MKMKKGKMAFGKSAIVGPGGPSCPTLPRKQVFFLSDYCTSPCFTQYGGSSLNPKRKKGNFTLDIFTKTRSNRIFSQKTAVSTRARSFFGKHFSKIQIQIIFPLPSQTQALQQSICNNFSEKCYNR